MAAKVVSPTTLEEPEVISKASHPLATINAQDAAEPARPAVHINLKSGYRSATRYRSAAP